MTKMEPKGQFLKKCKVISMQKHIHDPRNENQNAHRINMGLIVCLHLCLLWEVFNVLLSR